MQHTSGSSVTFRPVKTVDAVFIPTANDCRGRAESIKMAEPFWDETAFRVFITGDLIPEGSMVISLEYASGILILPGCAIMGIMDYFPHEPADGRCILLSCAVHGFI